MPKVILQFDDQTLKDYVVGPRVTIGRLPDNTVVIDNPAVSGHHASIVREADRFILEDLRSRNGTYVNEKQVYRHPLQNGDVVLIGKHQLRFDEMAGGEAAAEHDEVALPAGTPRDRCGRRARATHPTVSATRRVGPASPWISTW